MAHVWQCDDRGAWLPSPLNADQVSIGVSGLSLAEAGGGIGGNELSALIRRGAASNADVWMLLCPPGVDARVNGGLVDLGIRALRDRDLIRIDNGPPLFFSTERLATIQAFPGVGRSVFCPRCKLPIEAGTSAIQCPSCASWHHQSDEYPCWTYAKVCALCPHPTALDSGYRWTPDEL